MNLLSLLFRPGKKNNEPVIHTLKKEKERAFNDNAKKIRDINKVLTNGFAIKVYYSHGGKHANS